MTDGSKSQIRLSTGVTGLDEILGGGLISHRAYLVRGGPGQGKTTLGLHFLSAAQEDERAMFIGFQEPEAQVKANAASVGIDVEKITFLTLAPDEHFFVQQQAYDVFSAAEVEQGPLVEAITQGVESQKPTRVFVDSLTQLRFLTSDAFQYRKQVLSFLRFLTGRGITALFSSENAGELPDYDLQFMSDGVINLESGHSGAAVRVSKFRGSGFSGGEHHMRLSAAGMKVFPRMIPPPVGVVAPEQGPFSSGSPAVDSMLHGGIETGTVTLITGPAGVGKTTLATQFVHHAVGAERKAAFYLFEEETTTFLRRAANLRLDLAASIQEGRLLVELVEPMRYLADEFTARVRESIASEGIELVVLDSIAGFELTLDGAGVEARLHTFATTLARLGVTVFLINETQAVTGQQFRATEKHISYISDNILFLRYMETDGELKKTFGVLKKRLSAFDSGLRSYEIGRGGLTVSKAALDGLRGVLSGMPKPQDGA